MKNIKVARAIWYKERNKQIERQKETLRENNLEKEFEESKYKSLTWFLKSKGLSSY